MISALDHDPNRRTQIQETIYDIKHRLRDDAGKVDRPQSYYRWRQEPDGRKSDQLKRLKELEAENTRLRQDNSNLMHDKLFLQEAVRASPSMYRDH